MLSRWLRARREPAQILVLFALGLPAMLTMAGLSIDVGNILMQRRVAQSAADAAALAGVRCLYQHASNAASTAKCRPRDATYSPNTAANNLDALDAVQYFTSKNAWGTSSTVQSVSWVTYDSVSDTYPTTTMTTSNNLAATSPSTASGVTVTVERRFPAYLLQVALSVAGTALPSNIYDTASGNLVVTATGQAQVAEAISFPPANLAPWASCGNFVPKTTSGATADFIDILKADGSVDYSFTGTEIYLQSSKMNAGAAGWLPGPPSCPNGSSSWKGKVDLGGDNLDLDSGEYVDTVTGNGTTGDVCVQVWGAGTTAPCYLWVPVADDQNQVGAETAHITNLACMYVQERSGDDVRATIADPNNCSLIGVVSDLEWTKGDGGAIMRLTLTQ